MHTDQPPLHGGAIVIGGVVGIAVAALGVVAVTLLGGGTPGTGLQIFLILIGFAGQTAAGFTAGTVAGSRHATHGALASAMSFLALAAIALASQVDPGLPSLLVGVAVALVIGSAGGVLAAATVGGA